MKWAEPGFKSVQADEGALNRSNLFQSQLAW